LRNYGKRSAAVLGRHLSIAKKKATRVKATRAAPLLSPVDFVADNAADRRTANRSDGAPTGKHGARDATDSGANRRILVLGRHPGTTRQAEHRCHDDRHCKSLHRFHWNSFIKKRTSKNSRLWKRKASDK
jgi:hypothetical protein